MSIIVGGWLVLSASAAVLFSYIARTSRREAEWRPLRACLDDGLQAPTITRARPSHARRRSHA